MSALIWCMAKTEEIRQSKNKCRHILGVLAVKLGKIPKYEVVQRVHWYLGCEREWPFESIYFDFFDSSLSWKPIWAHTKQYTSIQTHARFCCFCSAGSMHLCLINTEDLASGPYISINLERQSIGHCKRVRVWYQMETFCQLLSHREPERKHPENKVQGCILVKTSWSIHQ